MNLAIVGSRTFTDYELLSRAVLSNFNFSKIDLIISGGANGADTLAEIFANKFNIPLQIFYPDWNVYGKRAGFIRNKLIIENSAVVYAFWDGKSKGTKNSIDLAKKLKKEVHVVYFEGEEK